MLVYHFMLGKFILYLKNSFWDNNNSKPVLITLLILVNLLMFYAVLIMYK